MQKKKNQISNLSQKVYDIVSQIPKGKVLTYKEVARRAGIKNPRLVGMALHRNTDPKHIPCHRVVRSDGALAGYAFGGIKAKSILLQQEGVTFIKQRVDLKKSISTQ